MERALEIRHPGLILAGHSWASLLTSLNLSIFIDKRERNISITEGSCRKQSGYIYIGELIERKMLNKDQSRLWRDEARSIGSECRVSHQARQESQVLPFENRGDLLCGSGFIHCPRESSGIKILEVHPTQVLISYPFPQSEDQTGDPQEHR